ncbi:MAG: CopG family transcriptional regulator, partial [Cyanobacteria bacterium P01_A01_bin.114]
LKVILKATYDAPLNFWLCEIEHKWSMEFLGEDASLDQELVQLQAKVRDSIDQRFQDRKNSIDKDMHYCLDRNAAVNKLADLFEKETQISRETQLGDFMIELLKAEAEERFAMRLTRQLKSSSA